MRKEFYQMEIEEVREALQGSHKEKNVMVEAKKKSLLRVFLEQFQDLLVIILIIAAVVSGIMGDVESTIVILFVITMNAIIGTVQTKKAESTLDRLKELTVPEAKVVQNGTLVTISSTEIQIGDEVVLEAGDVIPADGRIIEAVNLKVDESALTGESEAVEKSVDTILEDVPLGDRKNMLYSGNFISYGRGTFLVTQVGMSTEIGKIASMLQAASEQKTPLQVKLNEFGKMLSILIMVFCGIVFAVNVMEGQGAGDAFMFAVALAVAAIPEALASIVTIVLAFGTSKMVDQHVIMRKLHAVEGLGSVSVICSDKTGTLTQNKMTVQRYFVDDTIVSVDEMEIEKESHKNLIEYSILCNDAVVTEDGEIGDPTETAMVTAGEKLGISHEKLRGTLPRVDEIPFDSDRKLMSTVHRIDGKPYLIMKGAFDVMLSRITGVRMQGEVVAFTQKWEERLKEVNQGFSMEGLRVLAVASKQLEHNDAIEVADEKNAIFLGFVAMMDPPREEAKKAVASCKQAGIRPVMITGDHKITASVIAKKLGILEDFDEACEGKEIETMSDEALENFVDHISVYARVSPEHKIRIVRAWQKKGAIVAMTGDGVNDAPALKQADIGIAMGITGSEVTKEAADMILTDDNFATIETAIENGRNIYENIKKSIQFLLSGNFAGIIVVLVAALLFLPVPFEPVHLLFINLLTDSLPAIALGLEPHSAQVMTQMPRKKEEALLNKSMLFKIGMEGCLIGIVTLAAYATGLRMSGPLLAKTMAFGTLCLSRLFHGFSCKSDWSVLGKKEMFNNVYLIGAFFIGVCLITGVLMIPGLHSWFRVQTLSFAQIGIVYGFVILGFVLIQIRKMLRKKR